MKRLHGFSATKHLLKPQRHKAHEAHKEKHLKNQIIVLCELCVFVV